MIDIRTPAAPVERVTPIKPSEAIRLGCLVAPVQGFTSWQGRPGQACALGALALGLGWDGSSKGRYGFYGRFMADLAAASLTCEHGSYRQTETLWHLNDTHRWSRERIADWLEGLGL